MSGAVHSVFLPAHTLFTVGSGFYQAGRDLRAESPKVSVLTEQSWWDLIIIRSWCVKGSSALTTQLSVPACSQFHQCTASAAAHCPWRCFSKADHAHLNEAFLYCCREGKYNWLNLKPSAYGGAVVSTVVSQPGLHVLPVYVCFLWLPPTVQRPCRLSLCCDCVRLTWDFKLTIGGNVMVNSCLSLLTLWYTGRPVQGAPRLSSNVSWLPS